MMEMLTLLNTAAQVATSLGIGTAAWQLWAAHKQAVTSFEDSFAREYRELAAELPTKAFLDDGALSEDGYLNALDEFYQYFDLTNEQIYLRQIGRVSRPTWNFWRDGIRANLKRAAFARAWDDISKRASGDFRELRLLIDTEFKQDPRKWRRNVLL